MKSRVEKKVLEPGPTSSRRKEALYHAMKEEEAQA